MQIDYSDVYRDPAFDAEHGARFADKKTLLAESDSLTPHLSLLPETKHYIGAAQLRQMKKITVLINTSRDPVVDEKALVEALCDKVIQGACLDVFEDEPALVTGLAELKNVVIVPHIAAATTETRIKMGKIMMRNVINVLRVLPPAACVNPQVRRVGAPAGV
jgi:glyoxylate reductase